MLSREELKEFVNEIDFTGKSYWLAKSVLLDIVVIDFSIEKFLSKSSRATSVFKWKCNDCSYVFKGELSNMSTRRSLYGCPCCAGKVVVKGINDFKSNDYHNSILDWDYDKNDKPPEYFTKSSSKVVWWLCHKCNYSWRKDISTRNHLTDPRGCPACSNQAVVEGKNDFSTVNKSYMSYWDYTKNVIDPTKITASNKNKLWFVCDSGHSFETTANNFTTSLKSKGRLPCPYCAGRLVTSGVNDALTLYPFIGEKWDYSKNTLTPDCVLPFSNTMVTWVCKEGHNWTTSIGYMCRENTGCPECWKQKGVSNLELEVLDYIKSIYKGSIKRNVKFYNHFRSPEVDIFLPDLGIALEINGVYYHSTAVREKPLYHSNKLQQSKKYLNSNIFFVWEDDWNYSKESVKSLLKFIIEQPEITSNKIHRVVDVSENTIKKVSKSTYGLYLTDSNFFKKLFLNKDSIYVAGKDFGSYILITYISNIPLFVSIIPLVSGIFGKQVKFLVPTLFGWDSYISTLCSLESSDIVLDSYVYDNKRVDFEGDYNLPKCYSENINLWGF